ncbi:hypothetical protein CVT25_002147, partial [Psilocybe cyanescens]
NGLLPFTAGWLIHNVFHVSKLHPFISPAFNAHPQPSLTPVAAVNLPTLAVALVISHRLLCSGTQFLVTLEGSTDGDSIWDTELALHNPNLVIAFYKHSHNLA